MIRTELRRLLARRLPELLAAGAVIEVYDGARLIFREVVARAFRLEPGGEQAALALWFRPIGEPEWEPRIGADAYPIERARCLLVDHVAQEGDGLLIEGPTGGARISSLAEGRDAERFAGWISFREVWLSPDDEAALDALRA